MPLRAPARSPRRNGKAMAKFEQADPRWIVADRADGTNVNAWHWQEKDCTAWSRRRLGQLFDGAVLVDSPRVVAGGCAGRRACLAARLGVGHAALPTNTCECVPHQS